MFLLSEAWPCLGLICKLRKSRYMCVRYLCVCRCACVRACDVCVGQRTASVSFILLVWNLVSRWSWLATKVQRCPQLHTLSTGIRVTDYHTWLFLKLCLRSVISQALHWAISSAPTERSFYYCMALAIQISNNVL